MVDQYKIVERMIAVADIEALAASDRPTWKRLEEAIQRGEPSSPALIRGLVAAVDPQGWVGRLHKAYKGPPPVSSAWILKAFTRWLAKEIVQHLAAADLPALTARLDAVNHYEETDASIRARELVAAIEHVGNSAAHRALLGRALLVLFKHLRDDDDFTGALAAAQRGEEVFALLGNENWRVRAVRNRASALLRLRRIDEALALTDSVAECEISPYAAYEADGGYVYLRSTRVPTDPIDIALRVAAGLTLWAKRDNENWINAIGALAALLRAPACIERHEAGKLILAEKKKNELAQWLIDQEEIEKLPGPMR